MTTKKKKIKWDKPVKALEVLLILFLPADLYIFPSSSCLLFHQHRKSLVERSYSSQRNEGDCFLFNFFPLSFPLVTSCSYKTWVSFYCISHRFFSLIFFFFLIVFRFKNPIASSHAIIHLMRSISFSFLFLSCLWDELLYGLVNLFFLFLLLDPALATIGRGSCHPFPFFFYIICDGLLVVSGFSVLFKLHARVSCLFK